MQQTKTDLLDQLVTAAQELPEEKLLEVCDFVGYMRDKYGTQPLERGSAEAILQALERFGPLQFEPGELDALLAEVEDMRALDVEEHD